MAKKKKKNKKNNKKKKSRPQCSAKAAAPAAPEDPDDWMAADAAFNDIKRATLRHEELWACGGWIRMFLFIVAMGMMVRG